MSNAYNEFIEFIGSVQQVEPSFFINWTTIFYQKIYDVKFNKEKKHVYSIGNCCCYFCSLYFNK